MGREGWIYGLIFLAVLGGGAWLIAPRLQGLGRGSPRVEPPLVEVPPPPPVAAPEVVHVALEGPDGPLLAPLSHVEGAEVTWLTAEDDRRPRLTLLPTADAIVLRAPGHVGRAIPLRALAGAASTPEAPQVVVLERAAPPLEVRVLEPDGRPGAGVPVRVRPWPTLEPLWTETDGSLRLDELPAGLVVLEVGGTERHGPTVRAVAGAPSTLEVRLEPVWVVAGRVVDEEGLPLSGAEVEALAPGARLGEVVRTGADGRFAWRGPVRGVIALRISRPPRRGRRVEVRPPSRGPLYQDVGDVELPAGGARLSARVVSAHPGSKPVVRIEPAVAAVFRELFLPESVLDLSWEPEVAPDGSFELAGLPGDLPLRISVRGAGAPFEPQVTLEGGEARSMDPLLPPAGETVSGRVLDAGGNPVVGLALILSFQPGPDAEAQPGEQVILTDAAGVFRAVGLPRGDVYLRAYPEDARTVLLRTALPAAAPLQVTLAPLPGLGTARLEGVVVDDGNVPLAGVTVRAAGRRTLSREDGRFTLDGVEGVGNEVRVRAGFEPGVAPLVDPRPFVSGVTRLVEIGGPALRLVLPRSRTVRFRVIDGIDDVPLSFVHVVARTDAGEVLADRPVAPVDGEVRLEGIPAQGFTLSLFSHRHRLVHVVPILAQEEPGLVRDLGELSLMHGMRISGRVLDADGAPIPYARLGGIEGDWVQTRIPDPTLRRELALRQAQADGEGRFVFEGFDPRQPAMIAAWAPGFAPSQRRVVLERFREDVRIEADVTLRRGGFLSVELLDAETDQPISGGVFDLEDARTGSNYLDVLRRGMLGAGIASDEDWNHASRHYLFEREIGAYRMGPLSPGPYDVVAHSPGYETLQRRLTILDAAEDRIVGPVSSHRIGDLLPQTWMLRRSR